MPPSERTLEIASALASGATTADVMARYGVSRARVAQIRSLGGVPAASVGAPRSEDYSPRSVAGREVLAVLVEVARSAGWPVPDALVWLRANLPRR